MSEIKSELPMTLERAEELLVPLREGTAHTSHAWLKRCREALEALVIELRTDKE